MDNLKSFLDNPLVAYIVLAAALLLAVQLARLLEAKRAQMTQDGIVSDDSLWTLDHMAEIAVKAVEQMWQAGQVEKDERRDKAAEIVEAYLSARGISFPVSVVLAGIEKAVLEYKINLTK